VCAVGLGSASVRRLDGEVLLLRPGGVTLPELEAVVGRVRRAARGEGPRAPGTLTAHYAPATPLRLVTRASLADAVRGPATAVLAQGAAPADYRGPLWLDAGAAAARYAHDLYANLRRLDHVAAATIVVETVPDGIEWEAVRDRLARAAAACSAEDLA
jgi:L-threonylcarbamoyladenylate synthase